MTIRNEKWKDLYDYEGIYQVSSLGRIKSLKRVVLRKNGQKYERKEMILKPVSDGNGYTQVFLNKKGKQKTKKVHKLVAIAFLDHKPCGMNILVDHKDNNPLNNNAENLQLISNRENSTKDRKGGSSKYIGVSRHKESNKWRARIKINNKECHLGVFKEEYTASIAYQTALYKYLKKE